MLFSHDVIRESQKQFVETTAKVLKNKEHLIAHAPTGLGKTAAALCPALEKAKDRDITIFYLTSRHTQHKIVLETVKKVNERNNTNFTAVSLIGKKGMCAQDVASMHSSDFFEYCKSMVENDQCEFYTNARGKENIIGRRVLEQLEQKTAMPAELVMARCVTERVCPYEMSLMLAEKAKVIVADYNYIFNPHIRDALFGKIKKKLDECIVIVDEGHNLPDRTRDMVTSRLSNKMMRLAVQEAKKYQIEIVTDLVEIQDVLNKLSDRLDNNMERLVRKESLFEPLENIKPVDELIAELEFAADVVRNEKKSSHIGSIAHFLQEWKNDDEGFARYISRKNDMVILTYRCLDPSVVTKYVFDNCYSAIVMSGTLNPTDMYSDLLGLPDAIQRSYPSPFPEENRLTLVIPKTTTKYAARSEAQFRQISEVTANIAKNIPGCVMLFFPSYQLRDSVSEYFHQDYDKPIFLERPGMGKEDKQRLLDKFASNKATGAALLGVAAGSFGEGVDLPGIVKGVLVIGLPLGRPDLETKQLTQYYDHKFGKGMFYGYIMPAFTKCIQNAGRCIRSETDRGVMAFIDERYVWDGYRACFPEEWDMQVSPDYLEEIAHFFGRLG